MSQQSYAKDQADFMDLCGQPRLDLLQTLALLKRRDSKLLADLAMHFRLIDEEVNHELKGHFLDQILNPVTPLLKTDQDATDHYIHALADLADDCIDSIYVLCSMLNKVGIPADAVWDAVQTANMAKGIDGKVVRRADGKILKPEGWVAADIKGIITKTLREQYKQEEDGLDRGG